ncbi:undecaprenyl-diphosphate phosphatase [Rubidibacter lacunae]|nr:undecaprenyl-diphosphate phosphatase [Rubidibacter lacunae]
MRRGSKQYVRLVGAIALGGLTALAAGVAAQPEAAPATGSIAVGNYNWVQAAVLGLVQGLTEFLPISSTAHMNVVPIALGWGKPGVTYEAIVQLGSVAAVLWYFWGDLVRLGRGTWHGIRSRDWQVPELRLTAGILMGTVPIVICGLLLKALVPDLDNTPLRGLTAIAIASVVMGLLLGVAEWLGTRQRDYDQLDARDGILMGLAQCLALIPGVSRSGSTITAGLFLGLERATAARFSFLMGIPAIALAGLVELLDLIESGFANAEALPLLVAVVTAVASSYVAIAGLIRFLQQQDAWVFVWYRLLFGAFVFWGIFSGWLTQ